MRAMLCIDKDRPDESLIQVWGGGMDKDFAICLRGAWQKSKSIAFKPERFYRVSEKGALWAPVLTHEELTKINGVRITMKLLKDKSIEGEWHAASGERGKIFFPSPTPSVGVKPTVCETWKEFKEWINDSRDRWGAVSFRGHGSKDFRLRTTLHRMGSHRLERYCSETLPVFCGHVEAILGARFDLNNADDYSVVLGLAQHHGLPTPLLDWTGSPYIAAFFAFADAMDAGESRPEATHIRVYALTQKFVDENTGPVVVVPFIQPYAVPLSITPRHNPRLYAQQGRFLVTNVADVERLIRGIEARTGDTLLLAADVPIACGREALEDLAFMGLNAATMFPGLDGVCRMMKHAMTFKRISTPAGEPTVGDVRPVTR